jgi:hypothetical protein
MPSREESVRSCWVLSFYWFMTKKSDSTVAVFGNVEASPPLNSWTSGNRPCVAAQLSEKLCFRLQEQSNTSWNIGSSQYARRKVLNSWLSWSISSSVNVHCSWAQCIWMFLTNVLMLVAASLYGSIGGNFVSNSSLPLLTTAMWWQYSGKDIGVEQSTKSLSEITLAMLSYQIQ